MRRHSRRLKTLARIINENMDDLHASVEYGWESTDSPIPDARLRRVGKGRSTYKLVVTIDSTGQIVFSHNGAETYRRNDEVVQWLEWQTAMPIDYLESLNKPIRLKEVKVRTFDRELSRILLGR